MQNQNITGQRSDCAFADRTHFSENPGGPGNRFNRHAARIKQLQIVAHPHPRIAPIQIAGIRYRFQGAGIGGRLDARPRHGEQRPDQANTVVKGHQRHRRQPVNAAAAIHPHQECLCLVILRMGNKQLGM